MRTRNLVPIGVVLVLIGCEAPAQVPAELSEADIEQIRATVAANVERALAGDAEGFAALFAEDAKLLPPSGDPIVGRENIRSLMTAMNVQEFTSNVVELEGRGDLAYGQGEHRWVFTVGDSEEVIDETGQWVAIWKRQADGTWLIWRDIWNNDPPASAVES